MRHVSARTLRDVLHHGAHGVRLRRGGRVGVAAERAGVERRQTVELSAVGVEHAGRDSVGLLAEDAVRWPLRPAVLARDAALLPYAGTLQLCWWVVPDTLEWRAAILCEVLARHALPGTPRFVAWPRAKVGSKKKSCCCRDFSFTKGWNAM